MEDSQEKAHIPATSTLDKKVEFKRDEKTFSSGYANSIIVESNAFDLKLIFGLYDYRDPLKPIIEQFSSMNIPWSEVKLLIYWMQLHLAGYERENGKIKVPTSALPPEIPSDPQPPFDNPKGREALDMMRKMRADFLAKLSEP
jgi:hypothetical protein